MNLKIEMHGTTDVGKVRSENQDQFLIGTLDERMSIHGSSIASDRVFRFPAPGGTFLVVADGMGGHSAGKLASSVAVECFARYLRWKTYDFLLPSSKLPDLLRSAFLFCNQAISEIGQQQPRMRGMGTTLTAAFVLGRRLYVAHAGDSACYLIREHNLEKLTTDHTLSQLCRDAKTRGVSHQQNKKMSHVLWNCLGGGESDVEVQIVERELEAGDLLLLCTDGLSKYVDHRIISELVHTDDSVEVAAHNLVDAANMAGGSDNIAVVLGRCYAEVSADSDTRRRQTTPDDDTEPYFAQEIDNALGNCERTAFCS